MSNKYDFIPNRLNKYSIRKFTVGTASILVGATLLFGLSDDAKADEIETQETAVANDDDTDDHSDAQTEDAALLNNENVSSEETLSTEENSVESPSINTVENTQVETTNEESTVAEENVKTDAKVDTVKPSIETENTATDLKEASEETTPAKEEKVSVKEEDAVKTSEVVTAVKEASQPESNTDTVDATAVENTLTPADTQPEQPTSKQNLILTPSFEDISTNSIPTGNIPTNEKYFAAILTPGTGFRTGYYYQPTTYIS
nr:YSIRK-type signal peptide-containing protein [Staphylococcus sp. IVB6246]